MSTTEPTTSATASATTPLSDASPASPRQAIGAANARFMEAFGAGDAAALAACYTADAQVMPANSDVITGTEGIAGFWGAVMAAGIAGVRLETVEVEAQGDMAVEVGRYALSGADGGSIDSGKYMVVWHRDGGAWKLHRDIWTTSRPAPTA
jgi:uncharacterized protein (TIGR02246 family)